MKKLSKVAKHRFFSFVAGVYNKRTAVIRPGFKAVSFTFDDAPTSAFSFGGKLLSNNGFKGTYYMSLRLLGQESKGGRILNSNELKELYEDGHEIGCHTADHCDAWSVSPSYFEQSILDNSQLFGEHLPQAKIANFSFPKGSATPKVKAVVQKYFDCCRGIQLGINKNTIDLNLLKTIPIFSNKRYSHKIYSYISSVSKNNGWLIFYTHDIRDDHGPYGCKPDLYKSVLDEVIKQNIPVLSVSEALSKGLA